MRNLLRMLPILAFFCLVLTGCGRDEELTGDIEARYTVVGYNDLYSSDTSRSYINASASFLSNVAPSSSSINTGSGYQRATNPNNVNIQTAGIPLGNMIGYDEGVGIGKRNEYLKIVDESNEIILQLNQTEVGLLDNSENLQVYYRGTVIGELFERENFGEAQEVESIEAPVNGVSTGLATVSERGSKFAREAVRDGTTITDYRHDGWEFKTEFNTTAGLFIPTGSELYVNGLKVATVRPRVMESTGIGRKVFDGFNIENPDGIVLGGYYIADEWSAQSFAYEFVWAGRKLGTLFIEVDLDHVMQQPNGQSCHGDNGCSRTTNKLTMRLEGISHDDKIENMRYIDMILALMPDQVNKDSNNLLILEEMLDAVLIVVTEPKGDQALKYGIAYAQEEDGLSVYEAYHTLFGKNK